MILVMSKTMTTVRMVRDGYINTAIIYGKNGSGKSMLGLALFDVTLHWWIKQKSLSRQ